jgi:exonuclease III
LQELLRVQMIDQNCVIVNWNVRGLNMRARRSVVRELVRDTRPTIVTLQETKLDHLDKDLVSEILGSDFMENFVFLPAQNTRGGILLAVHEDHYKIHSSDLGVHYILLLLQFRHVLNQWSGALQRCMGLKGTMRSCSSWGS